MWAGMYLSGSRSQQLLDGGHFPGGDVKLAVLLEARDGLGPACASIRRRRRPLLGAGDRNVLGRVRLESLESTQERG